jgi:hypothetical protein
MGEGGRAKGEWDGLREGRGERVVKERRNMIII